MRRDQHPKPAIVVPPGESIQDELAARGWTQRELARRMRRPMQAIDEIIRGRRQITADTALTLADVFGTSAEMWMGLESRYRLHLARQTRRRKLSA